MAIRGNLRTMQLSELLQWLSMGQKTGTLVVRGKAGEKRITFGGGRIISSSSTIEREYLGHFLVAFGYITEEELARAMEVQEESKILLGKILVMIGAIEEEELAELIKLKASETIYDIFLWTEGAFEFHDGEVPQLPMIPASIDVTAIVMEGLRRYDEWQQMKSRISSTRQIAAITSPVHVEALADRERTIVAAIDGERSIEEISLATHVPEFFVARVVFQLMEARQAEIVRERPDQTDSAVDLTPEDPYAASAAVFEEAVAGLFQAPPEPDDAFASGDAAPATPPPGGPPKDKDFSRYLRRGPDSGAVESGRSSGRTPSSAGRSGAYRLTPLPPSPPPPTPESIRRARSGSIPIPPPVVPAARPAPPPVEEAEVEEAGEAAPLIPATAIPILTKPMDELMSWSFTPNEAFIVSRINGHWDVKSIVKISPFSEREVLRVFRKLEDGGVIAWR